MRWLAPWLLSYVLLQAQTTVVRLAWDTVSDTNVINYFIYAGIGGATPATNANYYVRQAVIPVAGATQSDYITVNNGSTTFWVTSADTFAESIPSTALTATIPVVTTAPNCNLSATSTTILRGQNATLTWDVTNGAAIGATIEPGIGSVSAVSSSIVINPANSTTYTMTVWNSIGTNTCTVPITVTIPAPLFTFSISPSTILLGASSTLTWSSMTDATSADIQPTVGAVSTSGGSISVSPVVTTIYTNTATGPGGITEQYATVTVNPVLSADFSASPSVLVTGSSALLNWTTYGVCSGVTIDNGIGAKLCGTGSETVSPVATTTYQMITAGTGGPITNTATITVIPSPAALPATMASTRKALLIR